MRRLKTGTCAQRFFSALGHFLYYALVLPWLIHSIYKCVVSDDSDSPKAHPDIHKFVPELVPPLDEVFTCPFYNDLVVKVAQGKTSQALAEIAPLILARSPKEVDDLFNHKNRDGVSMQLLNRGLSAMRTSGFMSALAKRCKHASRNCYLIKADLRKAMDASLKKIGKKNELSSWKVVASLALSKHFTETDLSCPVFVSESVTEEFPEYAERELVTMWGEFREQFGKVLRNHNQWLQNPRYSREEALEELLGDCISDAQTELEVRMNPYDKAKFQTETTRFPIVMMKCFEFKKTINELLELHHDVTEDELQFAIKSFDKHAQETPSAAKIWERVEGFRICSELVNQWRQKGMNSSMIWDNVNLILKYASENSDDDPGLLFDGRSEGPP